MMENISQHNSSLVLLHLYLNIHNFEFSCGDDQDIKL